MPWKKYLLPQNSQTLDIFTAISEIILLKSNFLLHMLYLIILVFLNTNAKSQKSWIYQ